MEYTTVGDDSATLNVSRVSVGTATFGVRPAASEVDRLVRTALDLGITCFDTANSYGNLSHFDRPGLPAASAREPAETLLGRALRGVRDEVVIATKVGEPLTPAGRRQQPMRADLSRRHILQQVGRSLVRLGVDRIDVYYAHHPDPATPLDETVTVFDDLVARGDIAAWAVSNHSPEQLRAVVEAADRQSCRRPLLDQVRYHLLDRSVEPALGEVAARCGVGVVAYGALGGGLLAGRGSAERTFAGEARWHGRAFGAAELAVARQLEWAAAEWGHSPAQVALAWALGRRGVVSALIGPGTPRRLHEAAAAVDLRLDGEQHGTLDAIWRNYAQDKERTST